MSAGDDAEFSTGAELSLTVADSELSALRSQIESELADIPVGVDASVSGGGRMQPRDPSTGQFLSIEGVEQRVIEQTEVQVEVLEDIKDELEGLGGFGGGGGGGLGVSRGFTAGLGGGLGATALGIGGGAGIAGAGIGAGVGLATGNIQLPEDELNLQFGNIAVTPVLEGPFVEEFTPTLTPTFNPVFEPEFSPVFDPEFSPQFNPVFNPEFTPEFSPTFNPSFDIEADLRATIDFSPSLTIAPEVNFTGIDLSGLDVDIAQTVVNSRTFQNALDDAIGSATDGLERRIIRELE